MTPLALAGAASISRSERTVLAGTAAAAGCLLFWVQPLLGRQALPVFGGTASVWTACLLFFQLALLLGYGLAWALERWAGRRAVALSLGLALLALASLPVGLPTSDAVTALPPDAAGAVGALLVGLARGGGLPFLVLATAAPRLHARAAARGAAHPFRVYAWSNAGAFAALLSYPLLVEPGLGLRAQALGWSGAFALVCVVLLRLTLPLAARPPLELPETAIGTRVPVVTWIAASAAGSGLLAATTEAISQDLSVTPLLWVTPLAIYLLTYVWSFARPDAPGPGGRLLLLGLGTAAWIAQAVAGWRVAWWLQLGAFGLGLLTACLAAHGELARTRPPGDRASGFYLALAVGGALGGALVSLVGPLALPVPFELPALAVAVWVLAGRGWIKSRGPLLSTAGPRALVALGAVLALAGLSRPAWQRLRGDAELRRGFYGTLQVRAYALAGRPNAVLHLLDGRISHGFQYTDPERRARPTAYFAPTTGVGALLSAPAPPRRVAILGLGVGTLAAYGRPGDTFVFYELNPDVIEIAQRRFTYFSDSAATIEIRRGDGRRLLAGEPLGEYDLLILDAFSGDAIPTHLLTREAMALYLRHLRPDGVLAINVSNNHADLTRVVWAHAEHLGLAWGWRRASVSSPFGPYRSDWVALTRNALAPFDGARPATLGPPVTWTDDHAPVLPLLR